MARQPPKPKPFKGIAINRDQLHTIPLPVYGSIKVDGIRGGVWASMQGQGDRLLSNSMLPFPNKWLNADFQRLYDSGNRVLGIDFEFTATELFDPDCFRKTDSAVMSAEGLPESGKFIAWVFDLHVESEISAGNNKGFEARVNTLNGCRNYFEKLNSICEHVEFRVLEQRLFTTLDEVTAFGDSCVNNGLEGAIFTAPHAPYKYGRSTEREAYRWKYKPYVDAEAVVVELIEGETNTNAATISATGNTKRSSAKAGKKAAGIMGTMIARDLKTGIEFKVATFQRVTQSEKKTWWQQWLDDPSQFKGRMFVYKYLDCGGYDSRRHATFKWWRDPRDLTDD